MDLARLKPHPDNPRIHPEKGTPEWDRLRSSLVAGYFDPLVWNKRNGLLVSGHYRLKILLDEGFKSADVSVVDWDEPTHRARMLAANELLGRQDDDKLLILLREIDAGAVPRELTGMTDEALESLLERLAREPAPPADPEDSNEGIKHKCPKCGHEWTGNPR
jgi:ParB-like chromosome segregation protein Spo0J